MSILAEGLTALFQILYLISAFNVIPKPGFTVIKHVLLFASVSSVAHVPLIHILLGTKYRLHAGFISDAHNHPGRHAEEPDRILLDLLDRNAVHEWANTRTTQRWRPATTRVHASM